MKLILLTITVLTTALLTCEEGATATPFPALESSNSDSGDPAYGFFPSPPEPPLKSLLEICQTMSKQVDFVLSLHATPWADFLHDTEADAQNRTDIRSPMVLARQNGLEATCAEDPPNGMGWREFDGIPGSALRVWDSSRSLE